MLRHNERTTFDVGSAQNRIPHSRRSDRSGQLLRQRGLSRCGSVPCLACARNLNATVIHVKVGFRPGFPEVSQRNRLFSSLAKNPDYAKMLNTELFNLHLALGVRLEEPVVQQSPASVLLKALIWRFCSGRKA